MSYTRRTVPRLLMRVWDLPTRLFAWSTAALLVTAAAGAWMPWAGLHVFSGYALLAALLFRVAWGFVGSETSRFKPLLRGPDAVRRQLAALRSREPDDEIGHNAAGGWLLLVTLGLLAVLVVTGLLGAGPGAAGPWAGWVSPGAAASLAGWHALSFVLLLGAVGVQVALAVAAAVFKNHDVVQPLLTGKKRLPANLRQPRFASPLLAAAVFAGCVALTWMVLSLA